MFRRIFPSAKAIVRLDPISHPDLRIPEDAEVVQTLREILYASALEEVWALLRSAMACFGFDRLNYAYAPALEDASHASRSLRFTLSSHPCERVLDVYRSSLLDHSPMRRWASANVGAISWSRQAELLQYYDMVDEGPALNALLLELGFHAGYTIGFPPSHGMDKGSMGLTARRDLTQADIDAIWARHGTALEAIAFAAHARMSSMPLEVETCQLSARQQSILGWVADGKSLQDVALLLDRSLGTVEKDLRDARARLGVETTAQAIARIALLNQLAFPNR